MAFQFNTIGLFGTHRNPYVAECVALVKAQLEKWGLSVMMDAQTADECGARSNIPLALLGEHCDCAIVVGGDGNLIKAARALSPFGVPVIGINRGQLGYLADINPDNDIAEQLEPLLKGDYNIEQRFLVGAKVMRDGKCIGANTALNDIVLFPGEIAQMIEFELEINGAFVYSQRSDGLIISTPTGSTAYSLSAGGPIVQPDLNAFILVPMFPHTLTSRPLVVGAESEIVIHISDVNKTSPRLSFDGQEHVSLELGDKIIIHKQEKALKLIHAKDYDYYSVLRSKLHWGTQLVPVGKQRS